MRRPKNLNTHPSLPLKGTPVIITPCSEPQWLEPDQCFVVSDVDFDQLAWGKNLTQLSSTAQLIQGFAIRAGITGPSRRWRFMPGWCNPFWT